MGLAPLGGTGLSGIDMPGCWSKGRTGGTRCAISGGGVHTVVLVEALEKYTRPSMQLQEHAHRVIRCVHQVDAVRAGETWRKSIHRTLRTRK